MKKSRNQIRAILNKCQFNDWRFDLKKDQESGRLYLQVAAQGKCNVTGEPWQWSGRKWFISRYMTKSEIVQTTFKAVLTAIEHESREQFKYDGVSIFDPHYDVDKLVALRQTADALDERH